MDHGRTHLITAFGEDGRRHALPPTPEARKGLEIMRIYLLMALAALPAPALADGLTVKPVAEARLRFEQVAQQGFAEDATAMTLRARAGVEATSGPLVATVIAQGNLALIGRYDDGLGGGMAGRPLVADPENVALSVGQLQYRAPGLTLTAGRQRILLDDERFVGGVGFRQNGQSFDAMRAQWTLQKDLTLDLSYAWRVNSIWGIEGRGARPRSVGGDNLFANLGWKTPIGTLSGFAYAIDQDEAAVQGYRLSSLSYGVRLAGSAPVAEGATLGWQLSHARQQDHGRNPNDYRARYWLADATLGWRGWKLNAGHELLGADDGRPFTSFQMPLGTNFKFQGWADRFLTTPPNGLRDLYVGGGYALPKLGALKAVTVSATWHRYRSDRLAIRYGEEWNLMAMARWNKTLISVRYADYRREAFAADTRKFWVQADWAI